jgi:hypothetical protein
MANKSSKVKNEIHRKELKKTMGGKPVNPNFYIVGPDGVRKKNPDVLKSGPRRGVTAKTKKGNKED